MSSSDRSSLSQGYTNTSNTPPSVSTADASTGTDRKDALTEELRRYAGSHIVAVEHTADTFVIEGRLVTPDTVFSTGRDLVKTPRRIALQYLWAVQGLICPGVLGKDAPHGVSLKRDTHKHSVWVPNADVHHLVKLPDGRRLHQARHLVLVCHSHNSEYGEPQEAGPGAVVPPRPVGSRTPVRESVAPALAPAAAGESSKDATQRHNWERAAWDAWIPERAWQELAKRGLVGENGWVLKKDLRDFAVQALDDPIEGKPSSVTMDRYIDEDRFTVLETAKDKGRWYVRLRREASR